MQRHGILQTLQYPSTTLGELLDQTAHRFGQCTALIYGEARWTYDQLLRDVNRLAAGLAILGVRRGDPVLSTLPNCPELVVSFLAVQKLGGVFVNAGPLIGADDMRSLCMMTRPSLVIALDLQVAHLAGLDDQQKDLKWLWVSLKGYQKVWKRIGYRAKLWQTVPRNGHSGRAMRLQEVLAKAPSRPPCVAPNPNRTAVLQPTGGTTGTLKVAQLSHRNLLANATQMTVGVRARPGQERILAVLPMFHVYGLSICLTTSVFNAATILPLTRFNVSDLFNVICDHRPTILPLAPAIIEPICDALEQKGGARSDVIEALESSMVTSGAAPLMAATGQRFERLTGIKIVEGYGLTEASPVTHINPNDASRPRSIGLPLPDTLIRVMDLNDPSREVDPGEPGEMLVSGPQVMSGYFNNPDETHQVLTVEDDGRTWLHTGDIVRVDQDGYYYVIDRRKEMINRGGLKVYPSKVERVLKMHQHVTDAAVIGRADPVKTEIVVAVLVLKDPKGESEQLIEELRSLCREHLAPYEVPTSYQFVESLPRTGLGKLQKHQLLDLESPSEHDEPAVSQDSGDPDPSQSAEETH